MFTAGKFDLVYTEMAKSIWTFKRTHIKLSCKILQDYARKGPFLLQDLAFVFLQDGFFWEEIALENI